MMTKQTLTLDPTAVSSAIRPNVRRLGVGYPIPSFSFDYADLNTVPASAYFRSARSRNSTGKTIQAYYTPQIVLPTEVTKLNKQWESCGVWALMAPDLVPLGTVNTRTESGGYSWLSGPPTPVPVTGVLTGTSVAAVMITAMPGLVRYNEE